MGIERRRSSTPDREACRGHPGDSSLSGSLIFATWSAVVEERNSGDWTGSASSGDVMDLAQGGMCE